MSSAEREVSRPTNCIICPGHTRPIPDISYSRPNVDGTFLVSSCLDGKPIIRSADSGDWIGTFEGHRGAVWKFRLNAAADHAVSASADFSAKVWDAIRGVEVASFDHKHIVKAAEFSPDGRAIVTGGHEKLLRIFDLEKPQDAATVLNGHTKPISHAFFSVDGNLIYSAGEENDIRVWDRRSLTEVAKLSTPAGVSSIEMSPDGSSLFAACGRDVMLFDTQSLTLIKSHTLTRSLLCTALNRDRSCFATGEKDELWVRLYDFATGAEIDCQKGHHGPINSVAFAPTGNGNVYATGSVDGTIRIWETLPEAAEATDSGPAPLLL